MDNTERSNVPLIIQNHFAYAQVDLANPRFTDSAEIDESDYDRALERGIGEIATKRFANRPGQFQSCALS